MSKARFTLFDLLMWVALAALVAALLAPMFGEGARSGLITKVAISADGSTAAALFSDGNVRVWDVADGNRLAVLPVGQNGDFALSADGTILAKRRAANAQTKSWPWARKPSLFQHPWIVKRQLPPSPIDVHEGETITVDFYVDPQAKKERPLPRTR